VRANGPASAKNRKDLFGDKSTTVWTGTTAALIDNIVAFDEDEVEDCDEHWHIEAGIERSFMALGKSTFYDEYFRTDTGGGLDGGDVRILSASDSFAQSTTFAFDSVQFNASFSAIAESKVEVWSIGYLQAIDAEMHLYIGYRNYSGDVTNIDAISGERESHEVTDFHAVMMGGRIRF
jgi:hypothetical protein